MRPQMRINNFCFVFFSIFILLFLFACSKKEQPDKILSNIKTSKISKVGIAYALGGKGDLTYNDASYKGVKKLQDMGIRVREFEPATLDDYTKGLELLSSSVAGSNSLTLIPI